MTQQNMTEEQIAEFVLAAHNNFTKVQEMYQQNPMLLNVRNVKLDETALQGAGHMGNRDIAEYLLEAGAPMTIFAAAMLGQTEFVRGFLEKDPTLANAKGVHRISLLYHAALSGKTEITQLIFDNGGYMDDSSLHAAVKFGHTAMVAWLLEKQVQQINVLNFEQKTPWSVASDKGFQKIANLLQKHGGTV
jgi:ankyrin repeat protein